MPKIEIRQAEHNDIKSMMRIHKSAFARIKAPNTTKFFEERLPQTSVAVCKGKVCGYGIYSERSGHFYGNWLAVDKKFFGHGIDEQLIVHGIKLAKELGFKYFSLDTRNSFRPALKLYLELGFDIVGTWMEPKGETMVTFRKAL